MATETNEIIVDLRIIGVEAAREQFKKMNQTVLDTRRAVLAGGDAATLMDENFRKAKEGASILRSELGVANREIKNVERALLNVGLTSLFAGILIQRTFENIAKQSLTSFMKVTGGTTAASIGIAALSANMEFLKFTVGDAIANALLPFIPAIISIIEGIAEFAQEHQSLIGGLIIGGIVFGALLFTLGQLVTTFVSLSTATVLLKGSFATIASSPIGVFLTGIITSVGGLLNFLILLVAAVLILAAAWETNFAGIRDITKNIMDEVGEAFGDVFGEIVLALGSFKDLWKAIFTGNEKEATASLFKLLGHVGLIFVNIAELISNILLEVAGGIGKILTGAFQYVAVKGSTALQSIINDFIDGLLFLAPIIKSVLKIDISGIAGAKRDLSTFEATATKSFEKPNAAVDAYINKLRGELDLTYDEVSKTIKKYTGISDDAIKKAETALKAEAEQEKPLALFDDKFKAFRTENRQLTENEKLLMQLDRLKSGISSIPPVTPLANENSQLAGQNNTVSFGTINLNAPNVTQFDAAGGKQMENTFVQGLERFGLKVQTYV